MPAHCGGEAARIDWLRDVAATAGGPRTLLFFGVGSALNATIVMP
jgi:hypothetical protein